jgi:hypothetical protein
MEKTVNRVKGEVTHERGNSWGASCDAYNISSAVPVTFELARELP